MSQGPHTPESAREFLEMPDTYRLLVEGIPVITYVDAHDEQSTALYLSPQVEEVLGYAPIEWLSNPTLWLHVMNMEDRDRVHEISRRCNETGEPFHAEYRMHARDGREVWIRDEAVLVYDSNGRPLFWRGVMLDITELKRTEAKLKRSLDMLRQAMDERQLLLARLEEAREEERKRIAADIHDDSIQVMAAMSLRLQMLYDDVPEGKRPALMEVGDIVNEAIDRLRHLVFELRPPALDEEGLAAALNEYLEQIGAQAGFSYRLHDSLTSEPAGDARTVLYRIAQEAIGNIGKHAQAKYVSVYLETEGNGVTVRVTDDGVGFRTDLAARPEPGHLGMLAMRERAELAGGRFSIESTPGVGTTVEFWLPAEIQPASQQSA